MKTDDFDYSLPEELIAQSPAAVRDACRMLVLGRQTGSIEDCIFRDILKFLRPGDLLVANETRVRPARLLGHKRDTGGSAEVFLLRPATGVSLGACGAGATSAGKGDTEGGGPGAGDSGTSACGLSPQDFVPNNKCAYWEALVRPGKRLKPGAVVCFEAEVPFDASGGEVASAEYSCTDQRSAAPARQVVMEAEIVGIANKGERVVKLSTSLPSLDEALHLVGNTPLPPYIKNYTGDKEMYQTVYSRTEHSAAAPTAGLHFTPELIERVKQAGVGWETVDLEVGLDTFRIVDEEDPATHQMHTELFSVPQRTVDAILRTKSAGGRVIAVGTTSVRSLESAAALASGNLACYASSVGTARDECTATNTLSSTETEKAHVSGGELLRACTRQATSLYILPGYKFRVVDGIITNFHVPRSTLLMLVSAFSDRDNIMRAYEHAIEERYRFFSFGDAMLII